MKPLRLLIGLAPLALGCESPSVTEKTELGSFSKPRVIHPEMHLGEYTQTYSKNSLVSVRRDSESAGLVELNFETNEIRLLDPDAREAKDIFVSGNLIAYRVDRSLRLWIDNKVVIPDLSAADRLRGILNTSKGIRLVFESENKGYEATVNSNGRVLEFKPLPGLPRLFFVDHSKTEHLLWTSATGLYLDETLIDEAGAGSYATARAIAAKTHLAWFSDVQGVLKIWTLGENLENIQIVDGEVGKSQIGHDIAIFDDDGEVGLIYLDALQLKPKIARKIEGRWKAVTFPFKGAFGFYNQILSEVAGSLLMATHAFRNNISEYQNSYEDLLMIEIKLDNPKK